MKLSPKTKRNISKIIPFAIIWWLYGWVTIITELSVTRAQNLNPETDIAYTIPVLIMANLANLLVGTVVGALEVVYLQKRFAKHTLRTKLIYKFLIYLSLFLLLIVIFYPIAFTLETGIPLTQPEAWEKFGRFVQSLTFISTLFHLTVSLFLVLIYSAVSENLGHHVFLNFFTGRYHQPKVEQRIFMFLDMKSSTTIAEAIGHEKYFHLLQSYYDLMSDPIINTYGEVYQYIGDEIVISWKLDKGLQKANCIQCFYDICDGLVSRREELKSKYGYEIDFKAGIHVGEVTIGEIGALKKEIVFTGDVLNTTARIQAKCNELNASLLISGTLKEMLPATSYRFASKGSVILRGKQKEEELYTVGS